jgi:ATP-dependent Lon protease
MSNKQNNKAFSMIADIEGDFSDLSNINMPESMPILAVRNLVLIPALA